MVQSSYLPPQRPRWLRVLREYGPAGAGASAPQYVLGEDHQEYIVKGSIFAPCEPYAAANELVCAFIGDELGLPVLPHKVLEMNGAPVFGSVWMKQGTFDSGVSEVTFQQCNNRERAYDLVVFDTWLCNEDRHHQNLIVRRRKQSGGPDELSLVFNDHSRCLLPPGVTAAGMATHWLGSPPDRFIQLNFVRAEIVNPDRLRAAVCAVEQLTEHQIRACVLMVPDELFAEADKPLVVDFLLRRRAELRSVFNAAAPGFAALQGATL